MPRQEPKAEKPRQDTPEEIKELLDSLIYLADTFDANLKKELEEKGFVDAHAFAIGIIKHGVTPLVRRLKECFDNVKIEKKEEPVPVVPAPVPPAVPPVESVPIEQKIEGACDGLERSTGTANE